MKTTKCPIGRNECIADRCSWAYVDFWDGLPRCALLVLLLALEEKAAADRRRRPLARKAKLPRLYRF
jgi:hypothetical protein